MPSTGGQEQPQAGKQGGKLGTTGDCCGVTMKFKGSGFRGLGCRGLGFRVLGCTSLLQGGCTLVQASFDFSVPPPAFAARLTPQCAVPFSTGPWYVACT